MKCLIADGESGVGGELLEMLSPYGRCDWAGNGVQALDLFLGAAAAGACYRLVIVGPHLPEAERNLLIKGIRCSERERGIPPRLEIPVLQVADLCSPREMIGAYYYGGCTDFLVEPLRQEKLVELLIHYRLITDGEAPSFTSPPAVTPKDAV